MQNNKWCVSLVCTEIACHWNKSTEKIARPCKISDLFVTKNPRTKQRDKKYREDLKSFNPWIEGHRNLNKEKFGNFLTNQMLIKMLLFFSYLTMLIKMRLIWCSKYWAYMLWYSFNQPWCHWGWPFCSFIKKSAWKKCFGWFNWN